MRTITLTKADLGEFRSLLLFERNRLSPTAKDVLEVLSSSGPVALDDQPGLIHDQWVALHACRIDHQKLLQIDSALDRIDNGAYGTCQDCGRAIARQRLNAIPWATYCVRCQERAQDTTDDEPDSHLAA